MAPIVLMRFLFFHIVVNRIKMYVTILNYKTIYQDFAPAWQKDQHFYAAV